ncbi:galanin-like peptide isoform X1 [Enhydra lutris kenyoni]|uniref:Galanin-like peptide isoform X1 n=1 Tax=Enhydra lutris kenyoni TaxID=391180 RepID=A0A2Y9IND7_ENHLU|nr:galanin-like peptide isoform X1 [Enhydra lutris kenyoni]
MDANLRATASSPAGSEGWRSLRSGGGAPRGEQCVRVAGFPVLLLPCPRPQAQLSPPLPCPVLHLPQRADRGGKEKPALEVLDLWKALDGLRHPRPRRASERSLREASAKPETAGEHGKRGGHRQEPGTGASSPSRADSTPMLALTAPFRSTPPPRTRLWAQHVLPSQSQTFPHNLALT